MAGKRPEIAAAVLTQAKQDALEAIRASWKIAHVSDMLSKEARKIFKQEPPNDDFFEEPTLALLQELAKRTENRKGQVRIKLEHRWSARAHHRADGPHNAGEIRVGRVDAVKNKHLRADIEEFICEFKPRGEDRTEDGDRGERSAYTDSGVAENSIFSKPKTLTSSARGGTATKLKRGNSVEVQPKKRHTISKPTRTPVAKPEDDASEHNSPGDDETEVDKSDPSDDELSSSSSDDDDDPRVPADRALSFIRLAWPWYQTENEPFDFSILPQHAYAPQTDYPAIPFQYQQSSQNDPNAGGDKAKRNPGKKRSSNRADIRAKPPLPKQKSDLRIPPDHAVFIIKSAWRLPVLQNSLTSSQNIATTPAPDTSPTRSGAFAIFSWRFKS
ncbi:uncharacterized protein M421DRAFT_8168 [Didymella exigua CBS 183.55]|uniref:Uncharacterized protein n=1 Tax=Didymella exigua CBS 183.55 TaxID=1150837 RepID=A0A6A5RBQ9_9PLEO|nr:uncharacterized protein M421DRAFT_8168 [Didymella exigua CBS 183.55]KAF1925082.1 hypothetical protein M421DRAFT_8168 [Didymella exigua CBS 183.55]